MENKASKGRSTVGSECAKGACEPSQTDAITVLNATSVSLRWTITAHGLPIVLVFTTTNTLLTCFSTLHLVVK
jgi:hypothetical protein